MSIARVIVQSPNQRCARPTVQNGGEIVEGRGELHSLHLDHEDRSRMLGMLHQVLIPPKLECDHQASPVAEEEGQQVVGRGSPMVEEPELLAQLVILNFVPRPSEQPPMCGYER